MNGAANRRLANTTNLTFHGIGSEALLLMLDLAGICDTSGSACLDDSHDPSHVIGAMKPGPAAHQSIRLSLGPDTTAGEILATIHALQRIFTTMGASQ